MLSNSVSSNAYCLCESRCTSMSAGDSMLCLAFDICVFMGLPMKCMWYFLSFVASCSVLLGCRRVQATLHCVDKGALCKYSIQLQQLRTLTRIWTIRMPLRSQHNSPWRLWRAVETWCHVFRLQIERVIPGLQFAAKSVLGNHPVQLKLIRSWSRHSTICVSQGSRHPI